jgi:hypothetical protein
MVRLIEVFHWMFEDERWRYKILFQGLILLVPVVGAIALLGWMAIICENLLAGRQDVARWGFHLRRGVAPLAMAALYWIGLGVPYSLLRWLDAVWAGRLPLGQVAQAYNDVGLLVYVLLIAPVFAATAKGGWLGGLNVAVIVASMVRRPLRTLVAGLVVLIALIVAILGFAVIVAAPFTIAYGGVVVATIAAWWAQPRTAAGPIEPARTPDGKPVPFRPPQLDRDAEGWSPPTVRR